MKKYNLFLDDMRWPRDAFLYTSNNMYLDLEWDIVMNYKQFVSIVTEKGIPDIVSFDHDLSDIVTEMWKNIIGYEGIYQVSSYGRIARIKKSKGTKNTILKQIKHKSGLYITLRNCGNDTRKKIHRIVLESFIGINPDKPQVNHKDGNRWNNNINNLEWCTNSENVAHSHRELERDYSSFGENHKNSKSISQYDKNNNLIDTYGSVNEAARQLKIQFTNIAKCAREERKYAGGFIWKYENRPITQKSQITHIENKDYTKNFFIPDLQEKTGFHCAKWLIEYCIDNNKNIPRIVLIHSMNPVGAKNIESLFVTYMKIYRGT